VGPVPVFHRLDLQGNGRITAADLLDLQHPIESSVRIQAVVAALDTNGDGAIDPAEFQACLTGN
jgi:Ca2+-binding EF-hand superfamily protein